MAEHWVDAEDEEPFAPEEDDITTSDHQHFYQYGKLVVAVPDDVDWRPYLAEYCEASQLCPNIWFISDHGNAHLISVADGRYFMELD